MISQFIGTVSHIASIHYYHLEQLIHILMLRGLAYEANIFSKKPEPKESYRYVSL